jgi:CMP-N,N'-diacetyllegionaminic acid synthase
MIGSRTVLAIIPARGGSKGIPRKNLRLLAGKPMLAYTIEAARRCAAIDRVVLSTDDEEIAQVGRDWSAAVPFLRPPELAGDHVTDLPVFQHALAWLAEHEQLRPDIVVHLRPTAPLRTEHHITAGIEHLVATGADSVRSVCRAGQHPQKMWALRDGFLEPFIAPDPQAPEPYNMPRQQLKPAFVQNGAVDVAWRTTIMDMGSMTGRRIAALVMPPEESVNVDDEIDLLAAEWRLSRSR